jgi:hypothetical protein
MTTELNLGEPELVSVTKPESKTKDVPVVYANQVYMANTPWDIQMLFGSVRALNVGQAITEPLVSVIMSPAHAKAMSQILRHQIDNYERQFGPIQVNLGAAAATKPDTEPSESKPSKKRRARK